MRALRQQARSASGFTAPEIGREGEQRPGNGLSRAISREERVGADPPGRDDRSRNNGSTTWPPPNTNAPER